MVSKNTVSFEKVRFPVLERVEKSFLHEKEADKSRAIRTGMAKRFIK
jgi:hypothetical protein